jgi:hypothetical protein
VLGGSVVVNGKDLQVDLPGFLIYV